MSESQKEIIWEDIDLIKPEKNYLSNKESVQNDITNVIKSASIKNRCNDIEKEKWKKNCPKCGKEQTYFSFDSLRSAIYRNTICNPCRASAKKTRPLLINCKRICSECKNEIIYKSVKSYLLCKRHNTKCRKCATKKSSSIKDYSWMRNNSYREKMSLSLKVARRSVGYGDKFKEKCRINKAKHVLLGIGSKPNYNKNACKFIELLNLKFGWNLLHAERGGEKMIEGFFVDGYDEIRNIVFEYDEPKHHTLSHEKRDKIKEKVVINKINPTKFIRYSERYDTMYDIVNKEVICLPH